MRRVGVQKFYVAPNTRQSYRSSLPSNARHLININKNHDEMVIRRSFSLWVDCQGDVKWRNGGKGVTRRVVEQSEEGCQDNSGGETQWKFDNVNYPVILLLLLSCFRLLSTYPRNLPLGTFETLFHVTRVKRKLLASSVMPVLHAKRQIFSINTSLPNSFNFVTCIFQMRVQVHTVCRLIGEDFSKILSFSFQFLFETFFNIFCVTRTRIKRSTLIQGVDSP